MSFSSVASDLQAKLRSELPQIRFLVKRSPGLAYRRITEIGAAVGKLHDIELLVNFPGEGKIEEFGMYGKRDLSLIMDKTRTRFPVDREEIKRMAHRILGRVKTRDAYMYEGKEGVKIFFGGGRMDLLPHSMHLWCEFTPAVTEFCDWAMDRVYGHRV